MKVILQGLTLNEVISTTTGGGVVRTIAIGYYSEVLRRGLAVMNNRVKQIQSASSMCKATHWAASMEFCIGFFLNPIA